MKKLIFVLSAIAVSSLSVISLLSSNAYADRLYRIEGAGRYGGDAYKDSSGNWYNDDPRYGSGRYGGGVIQDRDGNKYNCTTSGRCTPW